MITSDQRKLAPPRIGHGVHAEDFHAGMMDRATVVQRDSGAI
jgi:hypothetical protein